MWSPFIPHDHLYTFVPPHVFRDISINSGRNICTQGLLYVRNGDVSRFYATTDFFEDFFSNLIFLGFDLTEKKK